MILHPAETRADEAPCPSPILGDVPAAVSAPGRDLEDASLPTAAPSYLLFWHASTRPTIERPSVAALLLVGWTLEHPNPWGALMKKETNE